MKYLKIKYYPENLKGTVLLPASKSISNRALLIRAMCSTPFMIHNLSDADDTRLMESLFLTDSRELYVKNAGTVARFLLAYFTSVDSDVVIRGDTRMHERPIGELVEAIKKLGGSVKYIEQENHLPVHILGHPLKGGQIAIASDISSQFISALLLIAPGMQAGLTLELTGEPASKPYIGLTLQMMAYFGIKYHKEQNRISIHPQHYFPRTYFVESDWSSASYFFAIAALHPGSVIEFSNLYENSLQGDSVTREIFNQFGCATSFKEETCTVTSGGQFCSYFEFTGLDYPDLLPALVCLCCALEIPFEITGTRTLQYKESNRAEVLKTELIKLGYPLTVTENKINYEGVRMPFDNADIILNTYQDHRMAMSFAILASKFSNIVIENPDVVEKSFPGFWHELENIGYKLNI